MNLGHLLHPSARPASTTGVTIGTPRLYEAVTRLLFLGRRRATYSALALAAGVRPGDRVVDVGCGSGYFARLLATKVGTTGTVVGVDAAPEMVEYAARRTRGRANCDFKTGSAESLPLADGSVDIVVSSLVLHHLPHEVQAAAAGEMRRVLRPGGTVLIADMEVATDSQRMPLHFRLTGMSRMRKHAPVLEPLLVDAGFANVQTGRAGAWLGYARGVKP